MPRRNVCWRCSQVMATGSLWWATTTRPSTVSGVPRSKTCANSGTAIPTHISSCSPKTFAAVSRSSITRWTSSSTIRPDTIRISSPNVAPENEVLVVHEHTVAEEAAALARLLNGAQKAEKIRRWSDVVIAAAQRSFLRGGLCRGPA